ncbi:MAG: hypothetical protein WAK27_01305, partial [Candidatus Sulfotelmatobacter sp.]
MDVIECLTGVFQPVSVHEIRRPIKPERPRRYRDLLKEVNLEPKVFVGLGKISCATFQLLGPNSNLRLQPVCQFA